MKMRANTNKTREPNGRWVKGHCPNPTGRPRQSVEYHDFVKAARKGTLQALEKLQHLMDNAVSERIQLQAAESIINHSYGRPQVSIAVVETDNSNDGEPSLLDTAFLALLTDEELVNVHSLLQKHEAYVTSATNGNGKLG